ncbi:ABC transporter permease [Myroides sp. LJL115]
MKKGFSVIFKEEVKRLFTTPRLILLTFGVPIFLFIFYISLFNQGVPTNLPIVVLDDDKSQLSRQLKMMVQSTSTLAIYEEVADALQGEKLIRQGKAFAMIIIPKDFQKNIQKNSYTSVTCYYNGEYILPGGLIMEEFQTLGMMFAAGARIQTLEQGGLTPDQALAMVNPINTDFHILFNPYTSYAIYLNLSFMPMAFQIVMMIVSVYAIGRTLKYQRGRELLDKANGNVMVAMLATLLPYTIIFMILGFFMNCLLYYGVGVTLNGSFLVVNLIFLSFVIAIQSMAFFLASIFDSLRLAMNVGADYAALAFSFAGYTFPEDGMSNFIKVINYIFPFTSYMRFTVDYAMRGIMFDTNQYGYAIAIAVFTCMGMIGIPFYAKKLQKGGYDA